MPLLPLFELPLLIEGLDLAGGVFLAGARCIVPRERLAGAFLVGADRLIRGLLLEAGVRLTVP